MTHEIVPDDVDAEELHRRKCQATDSERPRCPDCGYVARPRSPGYNHDTETKYYCEKCGEPLPAAVIVHAVRREEVVPE